MAKIVPIRGVRYNPEAAGNMSDLVTPPYDVINEAEQKRFYNKNPYNIIRLEYGEIRSADDGNDNRYTRANAFFTTWLEQNVLIHQDKPTIYLYAQEFTVAGQRLVRSGFLAGVGIEEYNAGIILPHEETLSKAKADRLELLRHCHANFSPIFGLYDDQSLTVEGIAHRYRQVPPCLEFFDENGEKHSVWAVSDTKDLETIIASFANQRVYIADGHHRYETALNYHREMQEIGKNGYSFTLMTLVNLHDPGLVILPTHRMVKNVAAFSPNDFLARLSRHFTLTQINLPASDRGTALEAELDTIAGMMAEFNAFLLYLGQGQLYRLTHPRNIENSTMSTNFPNYSPAWHKLDVAVLQGLILENLLGINREARASGTNLAYARDEVGALDSVDSGEFQAVFYLNPTLVREVTEVAAAGDKMPQKSTFFYPKLITGIVINDFSL